MIGVAGSFATSFFWAVAPLPVALNRLTKEETPLTFFTLLLVTSTARPTVGCGRTVRRWYDLSAISFGLGLASQYILHLLGLNALAWFLAGKMGLNRKLSQFSYKRFFFVMFLTFVLVNRSFSRRPTSMPSCHWLHHDGVKHTGYDFDGTLYMNFPSRLLAGVPWFYYLAVVGKDTDSDPAGRHPWLRTAFARAPDARIVLFSVVRTGSVSRTVGQWSQVDSILTSALALFSSWQADMRCNKH
jgi:hypothetical protein